MYHVFYKRYSKIGPLFSIHVVKYFFFFKYGGHTEVVTYNVSAKTFSRKALPEIPPADSDCRTAPTARLLRHAGYCSRDGKKIFHFLHHLLSVADFIDQIAYCKEGFRHFDAPVIAGPQSEPRPGRLRQRRQVPGFRPECNAVDRHRRPFECQPPSSNKPSAEWGRIFYWWFAIASSSFVRPIRSSEYPRDLYASFQQLGRAVSFPAAAGFNRYCSYDQFVESETQEEKSNV